VGSPGCRHEFIVEVGGVPSGLLGGLAGKVVLEAVEVVAHGDPTIGEGKIG
jgi:hypothetical protein